MQLTDLVEQIKVARQKLINLRLAARDSGDRVSHRELAQAKGQLSVVIRSLEDEKPFDSEIDLGGLQIDGETITDFVRNLGDFFETAERRLRRDENAPLAYRCQLMAGHCREAARTLGGRW